MWRYLKAAFLVGVDVPGLGRLPVNALAAAAFGIFGFVEHPVWLLGAGVEASVLFALTTSDRFRKVVDAQHLEITEQGAEEKKRALIATLPADLQHRLLILSRSCDRISELTRQSDEFLADTNGDALQRLQWTYLKLLVARNNLLAMATHDSKFDLTRQIGELETSLRQGGGSETLRESKQATLAILKERLANFERRRDTLDEIDSDLARIEAQVQLLLENASLQGKPASISTDIELASNLASGNLYGDSGGAVADLDQALGHSTRIHEN